MSEVKKSCALLLRVSTDKQTNQNQRPDLVALARAKGLEVVAIFEEVITGAGKARPVFERMWTEAHSPSRAWSHLAIWDISRLGRSMAANLNAVLQLDQIGVTTISHREPWLEMRGPVRDLLVAIFSWVASQEKQAISDRTKASLARLRAAGKHLGRPRVQVDLAVAVDLIDNKKLSIRAAATKLKIGASTLHRLLAAHRTVEAAAPIGALVPETSLAPSVFQNADQGGESTRAA
jgi:DNA invertase Pin-like site-specific DNA recombinase